MESQQPSRELGLNRVHVQSQTGGCMHTPEVSGNADMCTPDLHACIIYIAALHEGHARTLPILCPQRLEMDSQADCAASVHLGSLAFQLWNLDLRRCCWVGRWDIKFEVKFIFLKVVDVPAFSRPVSAVFVACDCEPVRV